MNHCLPHRTLRLAACLIIIAALASGCGSAETRVATGTRDGILHYGNGTEPKGLDPHTVTGMPEYHILLALFEGLVTLDNENLEVIPGVAESWDISDDRLVYTFHLRDDAQWSNGDPVTAHDFVYAWRRILTATLGSKYAYMLYCMKNAEAYFTGEIDDPTLIGAKAIDERTLEVTLNAPTPYFLSMQIHYTWFPVHQKTIESFGAMDSPTNQWTRAGNMVSNGPFELTQWEPNRFIEVVKNDAYWDKNAVRLNGIRFYPIDNRQTVERSFRVGDLHMTNTVPPTKVAGYRSDNPEALMIHPNFGSYYYRFCLEKPPLDDKRVRRALAMAINREAICTRILQAGEVPATALTPPTPGLYVPRAGIPFDLDEAKRLLAEAGYPGGEGMPPVEILYNTDSVHREIAEAIQAMWKRDLGVEATILNQEWKVYLDTMNRLDYSVARSSWYGDFLDPINFLECMETGGGNNRTGWSSPEFDGLLAAARTEPDSAARLELLQQAEAILMDEAPIAPIYTYVQAFLKSPDVKGWHPNMLSHVHWKFLYLETAPS
jgi:oligopeptide transport system substrate-binding protein